MGTTVELRDYRRDLSKYETLLSCDNPIHSTDYVKVTGWYASDQLAIADARAKLGRDPALLGMTKVVRCTRLS